MNETKDLLTTREVAAELGLRPHTLDKWRITGRGPRFRKLGRSVRYSRADVQAFVDAAAATSTADYEQR